VRWLGFAVVRLPSRSAWFPARGFTLVELLVVIVVIGVLAAIAIPVFLSQADKASDASLKSDLASAAKLLQVAEASGESIPSEITAGEVVDLGSAGTFTSSQTLTVSGSGETLCVEGVSDSGNTYSADLSEGIRNYDCDGYANGIEPLVLSYPDAEFMHGSNSDAVLPVVSGGFGVKTYALSGSLPDGVSFDSDTGEFAGPLGSAWAIAPTVVGDSSLDLGESVAVLADGSVVVTGHFQGTVQFGSITLTTTAWHDVFVAKMDANGQWVWATRAGSTSKDMGDAVTVLNDGSVVVTGWYWGAATFGGTSLPSAGGSDVFVAKLDADGEWLWATKAGGTGIDRGEAIGALSDGSVIVTGHFNDTATFGSTDVSADGYDIFVAKVDASGNWVWVAPAGGDGTDSGLSISTLSDGSALVSGVFWSDPGEVADFGSLTLPGASRDVFVAKVSATGEWVWATKAGENASQRGYGIEALPDGSAIVTGYAVDNTWFGDTKVVARWFDVFVAKISATGDWEWVTLGGGTGRDFGRDISVLQDGSAIVTGEFEGSATFGDTTLTSAGGYDVFTAKISPTGDWEWAEQAGSTGDDESSSVDTYADGSAAVTGGIRDTAQFDTQTVTAAGDLDMFTAKISAGGQWEDGAPAGFPATVDVTVTDSSGSTTETITLTTSSG